MKRIVEQYLFFESMPVRHEVPSTDMEQADDKQSKFELVSKPLLL